MVSPKDPLYPVSASPRPRVSPSAPEEPSCGTQGASHIPDRSPIAIVAVTKNGVKLALQIQEKLPGCVCYVPNRYSFALAMGAVGFERIRAVVPLLWHRFRGLVFIMATGIVVREIAPLLKHKTEDPAVVVLDERGEYVVSLVSGHLGGANRLAQTIARITAGQPVITTASDVQNRPAIDLIAQELELEIENPVMLPLVARRLLEDEPLWVYDPSRRLDPYLAEEQHLRWIREETFVADDREESVGVWVSEYLAPEGRPCLILRPHTLVVGIGCNRGTAAEEILDLVRSIFERERLSLRAIRNLASIDAKSNEEGILEASRQLGRPVRFLSRQELENVAVPNPSQVVLAHMGVDSVCEATALVSAQSNKLIVTKVKTANVTLAVARVFSRL